MGISCLHCCEVDAPELGWMPGELNRIAESDGQQEPANGWAAPRHPDTVQAGTTDVPAVGQRSGTQGPGPWRTEEGSECAVHAYLVP